MDKIAILIPCYNESKTIQKVISDYQRELPEAMIYVYDNNSTDETTVLASQFEKNVIVRHEYQQGKGNVIRRMFREIDAECYIMVDGDDTYPAEYAQQMVDKVLQHHADMVVGDRLSSTYFIENKRPFHNFGNAVVTRTINLLFQNDMKDIMTGYRAFSYQFVKTFPVLSGGFEIETEMTIHALTKRMQVENIIIQYRDRPQGSESKLNTYTDGVKVIKTMIQLFRHYKPMSFFGTISAVFMLLSISFFTPIFWDYLQTGLVMKFPTLIVCGFAMIAGIQSFFTGLILSKIVQKDNQDFEVKLNAVNHEKMKMMKTLNRMYEEK